MQVCFGAARAIHERCVAGACGCVLSVHERCAAGACGCVLSCKCVLGQHVLYMNAVLQVRVEAR